MASRGRPSRQPRLLSLRRIVRKWTRAIDRAFDVTAFTRRLDDLLGNPELTADEVAAFLGVPRPANISGRKSFSAVAMHSSEAAPDVLYARGSKARVSVDSLIEKGVTAFIAKEQLYDGAGEPVATFVHPEPRKMFLQLLKHRRQQQDTKIIAVTGSSGKTTVKDMIYLVAATSFQTELSVANANGFHPIASNLQRLRPETEVLVQETGAGSQGLVRRSSRFLMPDAFVITNIGYDHAGKYRRGRRGVLRDKLSHDRYLRPGGLAFVNWDDRTLRKVKLRHEVVWFSAYNDEADFYARGTRQEQGRIKFEVVDRATRKITPVTLNTHGIHNVGNAVAAFAVGRWLAIPEAQIAQGLSEYRGWGTRQNLTELSGQRTLVDCYNASELSVGSTIDALESFDVPPSGRRVLVLGSLDDKLGKHTVAAHARVGADVASREGLDLVVLYGPHTDLIEEKLESAGRTVFRAQTRAELHSFVANQLGPADIVAWKGGQEIALALSVDAVHGTDFYEEDIDDYRRRSREVERPEGTYMVLSDYGAVFYSISEMRSKNLVITGTVDGTPVYSVGRKSCAHTALRTAVIPEPVRTIGARAFVGCWALTKVNLPRSLRFVGPRAFRGCISLREIRLPEGTTTVQDHAFRDCWSLKDVHLPATLQTLGEEVFRGCPRVRVHVKAESQAETLMQKFPQVRVVRH